MYCNEILSSQSHFSKNANITATDVNFTRKSSVPCVVLLSQIIFDIGMTYEERSIVKYLREKYGYGRIRGNFMYFFTQNKKLIRNFLGQKMGKI